MSVDWAEIKRSIQEDLLTRGLKEPRIRLGALDRLERLLRVAFPGFEADINILRTAGREAVERDVAHLKAPATVNSAEKSMLGEIFRRLGGVSAARVPVALPRRGRLRSVRRAPCAGKPGDRKLLPLAEAVAELLERQFGDRARFELEARPSWLPAWPPRAALGEFWRAPCAAYSGVLDGAYDLDRQVVAHADSLTGQQRVDVWFEGPYSFILEYDEKQHFNQFRGTTLAAFDGYASLSLDLEKAHA